MQDAQLVEQLTGGLDPDAEGAEEAVRLAVEILLGLQDRKQQKQRQGKSWGPVNVLKGDDRTLAAIEQLAGSNYGLVPLWKLGPKLGMSLSQLTQEVIRLVRARKITTTQFEGRFGMSNQEAQWLIRDNPAFGDHPIGFVALRQ